MCKFFEQLDAISRQYGNEMLTETGKEFFNNMAVDHRIRFIVNHPTQ